MNIKQNIKNLIGSILGYGNCPICGNTYWNDDTGCIYQGMGSGLLICSKCYEQNKEKIKVINKERMDKDGL